MRFPNHVSVIWDVTGFLDWVPALIAVHHHIYTAPPPVLLVPVPMGASMELPSIIAHPPGAVTGTHKLTSSVYHNHVWFALEGHDLGHLLVHICLPPAMPGPCTQMPLNLAFSSRKAKFAAGEVKANGKAVACCTIFDLAVIPTPMLICGAMPVPSAGCGTSVAFNSLLVGMSGWDLVAGYVDVIVSIIQSTIMNAGPVEAGSMMDGLGINPVPELGPLAGGAVRLLGQLLGDYHGDASGGYSPVDGPLGGDGATITRDGDTGDVTIDRTTTVQAGGLVGGSFTDRQIVHSDGSVTHQEVTTGSMIGGGQIENTRTIASNAPASQQPREGTTTTGPNLPWSEGTGVPFL